MSTSEKNRITPHCATRIEGEGVERVESTSNTSFEKDKEVDEDIFKFAYRMALDDATAQQAYKGRGEGSKTKLRECRKARKAVEVYIEEIFDEGKQPNFAKAAKDVMDAFKAFLSEDSEENDDAKFTFGNAQKLINMTAKYMFMATFKRPDLRKRFTECHCPMDSIMLKEIVKEAGEAVGNPKASNTQTPNALKAFIEECAYWRPRAKDYAVKNELTWSQLDRENELDRERYDLYQKAVRELAKEKGLLPIEYDFHVWK